MKEIKLKNGEILTISSPTLDDAQELADYANTIRYESKFITMGEENVPARHLYKKFGFYETGYINHGMKYADETYAKLILMQKDLK